MKKSIFVVGIISVTLTIGFFLSGCMTTYYDTPYYNRPVAISPADQIRFFKYEVNTAGTGLIITGFDYDGAKNPDTITIPSSIDGVPVVQVGKGQKITWHQYNKEILYVLPPTFAVILPNSVTVIGERAFEGQNISSIRMEGVQKIGAETFRECRYLSTINLPNIVNIGYSAFYFCDGLKDVTLSNNRIVWESRESRYNVYENNAFYRCTNLSVRSQMTIRQAGYGDNFQ